LGLINKTRFNLFTYVYFVRNELTIKKLYPMKKLLKKSVLLIVGLALVSIANATVHLITVQNDNFNPSSVIAVVGDTIEWDWVAGTHTTTSETIPGGAALWSDSMTATKTTFQYKVTVAGTYNYECTIHINCCGMKGTITATNPTGVPVVSGSSQVIAKFFPNPVTDILNIHLNIAPCNNILIITDMLGREVLRKTLFNVDNSINVSNWKKGIYFYQLKNSTDKMAGKLEVQKSKFF
jgi:plastocyanin